MQIQGRCTSREWSVTLKDRTHKLTIGLSKRECLFIRSEKRRTALLRQTEHGIKKGGKNAWRSVKKAGKGAWKRVKHLGKKRKSHSERMGEYPDRSNDPKLRTGTPISLEKTYSLKSLCNFTFLLSAGLGVATFFLLVFLRAQMSGEEE